MTLSKQAQDIFNKINKDNVKLGELRAIAKTVKKNHELAMELWSIGGFYARQLAILIMDKKLLTQELIDKLDRDIESHPSKELTHLSDWLMANQLMKDKRTIALIESWEHSQSTVQRRTFWYYQGRLRWTGQTPPDNTESLLKSVESNITKEVPEVQWAMNFTTAWIGIYEEKHRERCIAIGENSALYKDEVAPKGCTPNYLPEFIAIEAKKRGK